MPRGGPCPVGATPPQDLCPAVSAIVPGHPYAIGHSFLPCCVMRGGQRGAASAAQGGQDMITTPLARHRLIFIVILLLCIRGFTGVASAQTTVDVKTVADLEKTLGSPDQPTVFTVSTDILIHAGTYLLTSPLPLDANPGVTVTLRNFGNGP